jgi:putative ABC transport system substrate-binding protein
MLRELRPYGVEIFIVELRGLHDLDRALATIARQRADAVLLQNNWSGSQFRAQIVEAIARLRLPAIFPVREYVEMGGLLSYGIDWGPILGRTALYVDRILRGAKPADLPIEQPTAFDLAINLKTAKALGITVPRELLVRADWIVE